MKKEPPLFVELMKFQKYVFVVNKHLPRQYKKNLGNDIIALTWEVLDSVMDCNDAPNGKKYVFLKKASSSFDKVRVRLRFGYEVGVIPHRRYGVLCQYFEDIGKMLSGWLSWAEDHMEK